jgi:tetratricopeptide (TPR) repeat protein
MDCDRKLRQDVGGVSALGRFDEAGELGRQAIMGEFDAPSIHGELRNLAIARNDLRGYQLESDWLTEHPPLAIEDSADFAAYAAASGRMYQSAEIAKKGAHEAQSSKSRSTAANLLARAAKLQAMVENVGSAHEIAALAAQASNDKGTQSLLAMAYGYAGEFRQAHAVLDPLLKSHPEDTFLNRLFVPQLLALEAIQRHDGAAAITALEASRPYDFGGAFELPYVRGLAYLASRQGQQAAAEFQKIIDHPGVNPPSPVHSLARLGLARAYVVAGDQAKARTAYQDFLALWKDADPDVSVLLRAKAEYAKLQ